MIMEAGIFQDLQGELASWRHKKSWCFNSSPKARKMGSVPVKSSSDRNNDLFLGGRSAFWFFPGFQLIGWDPPTLGRLTCFTQPPDWNVCLMRYTLTEVPGVRLDHRAGHQAAQSTWHVKLTIMLSESIFAEGVNLRLRNIGRDMQAVISFCRLPFLTLNNVLFFSPLHKWGNWDSDQLRFNALFKVTELFSRGAETSPCKPGFIILGRLPLHQVACVWVAISS